MRKVLIVTYCYPPCNAISALRPKSFVENFPASGLYPIVFTRHWSGNESTWEDLQQPNLLPPRITETEDFTLVELPYEARAFSRFKRLEKIGMLRSLVAFWLTVTGRFQIHNNATEIFESHLKDYLSKNAVDYLLVTCDPLSVVKLGNRMSKRFGIPLIVDFRDLWNNDELRLDYQPGLRQKIIDNLHKFYLRKWLRRASLVSAVSEPILERIKSTLSVDKGVLVTNGYETKTFEAIAAIDNTHPSRFVLSVIGTIFPKQDLSIFIDGIKMFLDTNGDRRIHLNFIGVDGIPEVGRRIRESFPASLIRVTDRLPRAEALAVMAKSHVLFYPGWRNQPGMTSGKIFEYLAARRNILIAPGDGDVLDGLVTHAKAGKIANSAYEVCQVMNCWFDEWRLSGTLKYLGDPGYVRSFSRENQARVMADAIRSIDPRKAVGD